jgi:hypothetical protein
MMLRQQAAALQRIGCAAPEGLGENINEYEIRLPPALETPEFARGPVPC